GCGSIPSSSKYYSRQPKDVIRRLQAKLSAYRKTVLRLRKQQKQVPRNASEALE
ncbi:hypothetical protein HPB47_007601, partial [Ixodes persulcatus]